MKIMVVGGGRIQYYLINEIKNMNHASVVIDQDPRCYCAGPADDFVVCDTRDHRRALEIAREKHIDAVVTAGTDVGYTVSYVAYHMGLPACHPGAAYNTYQKHRMRDLINLATPTWLESNGRYWEWEEYARERLVEPYPCVVKPVDLSASRGITLVEGPRDYQTAYWKEFMASPSQKVVVEQCLGYVDGKYSAGGHREVAVDIAMIGGKPYIVNSADRVFSSLHPGLEVGYVTPAFKNRPPKEIWDIATKATKALGVTEGPFKMDLIYDSRYGWCLLECATRWSGAFDHSVCARIARNRNFTRELLDYAITGHFEITLKEIHDSKPDKYCAMFAPTFEVGQLITDQIIGIYQGSIGISEVIKTRDKQGPVSNASQRPLFIFGIGDTPEQAWKYCTDADNYRKDLETSMNPIHLKGLEDSPFIGYAG
jgi:carbamoyl-phosphate synthase large subunit